MHPPSTGPSIPAAFALLWLASACQPAAETQASAEPRPEGPAGWVHDAIQRHGGETFEHSRITFTFRGVEFEVLQDGGLFRHERRYTDEAGRSVVEIMDNDGTRMEVDGEPVALDPDEFARVEMDVNSVVYFGFLPFRLLDPAANHRDLGAIEIDGEPYRMIEVTFEAEGGGTDWQDRFVHWIHRDRHTLDFLAVRYDRDGGGARFRRAINRREEGGLLLQDYENYRPADGPIGDIADFARLFEEEGALELLSLVELEEVRVQPLRP